jgi:hypothetical protein
MSMANRTKAIVAALGYPPHVAFFGRDNAAGLDEVAGDIVGTKLIAIWTTTHPALSWIEVEGVGDFDVAQTLVERHHARVEVGDRDEVRFRVGVKLAHDGGGSSAWVVARRADHPWNPPR